MIRSALDGHRELTGLNLTVFAQGSYKANTNVRADSDIDICVRCSNTFHYETLPYGVAPSDIPILPATLTFPDYKLKLERALTERFKLEMKRGDKAFQVKENTYRIVTDVVPTFEYKKYSLVGSTLSSKTGSCFFTDSGRFIVNWPEETLANGRAKNVRTGRRYKMVVRVLKGLRNEMEEKGDASAKLIASFQIACLAYNVTDSVFGNADLYDDVKAVVGHIWYSTYDRNRSSNWTEIDEIKSPFPADQPNRPKEVADFFWAVKEYAGLKDD